MSRFKKKFTTFASQGPAVQLLLQLLISEKINIRAFFIFSVASSVLLLAIPFGIQSLVEQFTLLYYQQSTLFLLICITFFLVGIGVMRGLQLLLNERFQRRIFYDAAKDMQHALQILDKTNASVQKKINHFFEIITLQKTSTYLIFDGLTLVLQTILGLLIISAYHPLFFVYSLCIVAALFYVLRILGSGVFDLALKESKYKYDIVHHLQQIAQNPTPTAHLETDDLLSQYFWARENKFRVHFKQSVGLVIIQIVASCLLLAIGGILVIKQKMTIGQLIAGELIITNVLISIFKFSNILDYWYDSLVSIYKIDQTLKEIENVESNPTID